MLLSQRMDCRASLPWRLVSPPFPFSFVMISLVKVFLFITPPLSLSLLLQVPEVISSIRQVSKSALKEDTKPKQEADEAFYNSQKFEVLYCGKVGMDANAAVAYMFSFKQSHQTNGVDFF